MKPELEIFDFQIHAKTKLDSLIKSNEKITILFYSENLPKNNIHELKMYVEFLKEFLDENNL